MLWHAISPRQEQHGSRDWNTRARHDGKYISLKKYAPASREISSQVFQLSSPSFLFFPEQWVQFIDIEELRRGKFSIFFLFFLFFFSRKIRGKDSKIGLINVVNVRDDVARIVLLFDDCSNNSRIMMAAYLLNSGQIEYYFESACITVQARAPSKPTLLSITHISDVAVCLLSICLQILFHIYVTLKRIDRNFNRYLDASSASIYISRPSICALMSKYITPFLPEKKKKKKGKERKNRVT